MSLLKNVSVIVKNPIQSKKDESFTMVFMLLQTCGYLSCHYNWLSAFTLIELLEKKYCKRNARLLKNNGFLKDRVFL